MLPFVMFVVQGVPKAPFVNNQTTCLSSAYLSVASCNMAENIAEPELTIDTVVTSIRETANAINHLRNQNDIDLIKLRLDYINSMLVTLDMPEEIINIISSVHLQLERLIHNNSYSHQDQYQTPMTHTSGRGRPKIDISTEQLSLLVDQGFTANEMSGVLGVGERTVQRRLAAFGLSISGKCRPYSVVDYRSVSLPPFGH